MDSGWFDVDEHHTVLVGPNEAGKTAVLHALLRVNPPAGVSGFDAAVDLPHRLVDLAATEVERLPVGTVRFALDAEDVAALPAGFEGSTYVVERRMGNGAAHWIEGGPQVGRYGRDVHRDLARLATHADARRIDRGEPSLHLDQLEHLTADWQLDVTRIDGAAARDLGDWLAALRPDIDADSSVEMARVAEIESLTEVAETRAAALSVLAGRVPMFVYFDSQFSSGFGVDIAAFADRYDAGAVVATQHDLADLALYRMLDMTPRELADLELVVDDPEHAAAISERDRRLVEVGEQLTRQLRMVWRPSEDRVEGSRIEVVIADGRLMLTATDAAGRSVPLQRRSSGFRWIVSFLVVFLAESTRSLQNTVVMLDEPGTSLHPGKQAEFRHALRRLGRLHQTLYTTHSPHLVDPQDLDRVRSVEHASSDVGTTVHTGGGAVDRAVTAPLVEAVGLRLATELFDGRSCVLVSSLTDYWYTAVAVDLVGSGTGPLAEAEVVPAGPIGSLVTLSAFLSTQGMTIAALVDADGAGVGPDVIARRINGANVVRPAAAVTRDGPATIEDLFAHTLLDRVAPRLGWHVAAGADRSTPVLDLLGAAAGGAVDRRRLSRAFVDWSATAGPDDVDHRDRDAWTIVLGLLDSALTG